MDLIPVNFKETKVLTTEQLAQVYECESRNISDNFKNNEEKFIEGYLAIIKEMAIKYGVSCA